MAYKPFRRWRKGSKAKRDHEERWRVYENTYTFPPKVVKSDKPPENNGGMK